jgi:hypothetical protein
MSLHRLTDEHPLSKKLEKLFGLMDELGVRFHFDALLIEVEYESKLYRLMDLEARHCDGLSKVDILPPYMEYKLLYEKFEKEDDNV